MNAIIFPTQNYPFMAAMIHIVQFLCHAVELAAIYAVGLTSEQMRAWPRMGRRQHLACWPLAAQVSMKSLMVVGVMAAGRLISMIAL
jgi:hypothetical protein